MHRLLANKAGTPVALQMGSNRYTEDKVYGLGKHLALGTKHRWNSRTGKGFTSLAGTLVKWDSKDHTVWMGAKLLCALWAWT